MKMLTLKQASKAFGLSCYELRGGALAGKYPFLRTGDDNKSGNYMFIDEDLMNAIKDIAYKNMMAQRESQDNEEYMTLKKIRKIKE